MTLASTLLGSLSDFPQTDYSGQTGANPAGSLWADSPNIAGIDTHVAGTVPPTSKIITATVSGFDGTAVGFVIDGITYPVTGATNATTFAALWNALTPHRAVAFADTSDASNVRLTLEGLGNPDITSYTPGAPDFTPITVVTAGSAPAYVAAGTAVVRDASDFGAVKPPSSSSVAADIFGIALRNPRHSTYSLALAGWDPSKGTPPGRDLTVIPGGYPKVALSDSPGAAAMLGIPYVVTSGVDAGKFRSDDGGTFGVWTATFSAANGTDAVGAYFNGNLIALGGTGYAGSAVDATNATRFAARVNDDPYMGSRFLAAAVGAVVTLTAKDKTTTWTIVKYKPATSDVTIANTVAQVAATAIALDRSRWGKAHASTATTGYLEFRC